MLNTYVWDLYKKSGGDEVISLFERGLSPDMDLNFVSKLCELYSFYCVDKNACYALKNQLTRAYDHISGSTQESSSEEDRYESLDNTADAETMIDEMFKRAYQSWVGDYEDVQDKDVFFWFIDFDEAGIAYLSTLLAVDAPEFFIPYYFQFNFNVLEIISDKFEIDLPAIPKKTEYMGRILYYTALCKAFYCFRKEMGLSPFEFCAFLYDFAPRYIGGIDSYIVHDLPDPRGAFFVGGGGDNDDVSAEDDALSIIRWQGNPETRVGDMVVLYHRSPISAISSVWRSYSIGFIDPFFYHYRCIYIGTPVKGSMIGIEQIKKDPILSTMPIVKKNMQGINGIELKPSEYNHILEITGISAPKLENLMEGTDGVFVNEKAVEDHLIRPLIKRLGYDESEYVQQMYIEIGNHNHALIPDFVLLPKASRGHQSGFAVIEAKRSIRNQKELDATKSQVRSYAKILNALFAVIASQEGIWITQQTDDYTEDVLTMTWPDLEDFDQMFALKKLIGIPDLRKK